MKRFGIAAALLLGAVFVVGLRVTAEEPVSANPPFPAWVFGHVVWEDESTTQGTYELVKDYLSRGIPVDGVIIDSPWETAYNTFEPDPALYPDMKELIADLRDNGVYTTIWITSMVNLEDPEYGLCLDKGYFVKGMEEVTWWKGAGGMLDYKNPEAVEWWHRRMDKAIDLGLEAWKCDGTDPFMLMKGWRAREDYSRDYYSDFYDYTRERTGRKTLIMARPMEQILNESTFKLPNWANPFGLGLYLKYAPVDKSYMSWVGDQDPTFDGMRIAMRWIMDSAENDYLILGSDIGGYRGGGPSKEVLIRWAQFGALCPFMENGGGGEHRPWMFDDQTVRIYRTYTLLHKALGPYLYSEAVVAWREGRSMITVLKKGERHYLLGRDILVAPVTDEGGKVKVSLPEGDDWRPLFADDGLLASAGKCLVKGPEQLLILKGGCSFTHGWPLESYPVFTRAGSAIPMDFKWAGWLSDAWDMEGTALLVTPPPAGKKSHIENVLYLEGQVPIPYSLTVETDVDGNVAVSRAGEIKPGPPENYLVLGPGNSFPQIPAEVPAITWQGE